MDDRKRRFIRVLQTRKRVPTTYFVTCTGPVDNSFSSAFTAWTRRESRKGEADQAIRVPLAWERPSVESTRRMKRRYLLGVIMPLWIASGAIDYVLHRRSRIEHTSGAYESRLHALGITLSAVPSLTGLLCELDAGALLVIFCGYLTHAGMTIWDVAYADGRREIVPTEQHVHAMLELLPFTALSLAVCAHPQQTLALFGRGNEPARFALRWKSEPLDRRAVAAILAAFGLLVAVPYGEELARCLRVERERPA